MDLTLEEVFEAYYECRKTKRYSKGALQFEFNLEENLLQLYSELKAKTWIPVKSTCFIVTKPVRREIFAAPFRDRIVHHIVIRRLNPTFEKYFIKGSYACRKQKGTHAAIKRVEHFIKSQTNNGKSNAYVLKLDIKGSTIANKHKLSKEEKQKCMSSINSYLGIISHYKTYKFRKEQLMVYFEKWLKKSFCIPENCKKIISI